MFRRAASLDPDAPDPYMGFGTLYEQQGKREEALEAYRKTVEVAKQAADRERAERRIEALGGAAHMNPKGGWR